MGLAGSDKDYVVVGATAEELLQQNFHQAGRDFPVFIHPVTHEEYALARTEKKSGTGYKGFICDFGPDITLEEDLRRRDFTINAIAKDEEGNLIDPYGGIADLNNKIIRHVSKAFSEDPLRVLRAARFEAKFHHLGFKIADDTLEIMSAMAASSELASLTPERVFLEITKALITSSPEVFFTTLHKVGALKWILPEVDNLFGVPGPVMWHPEIDSGVHTMMTLHQVCLLTEDPKTRFAMLVHDIGKALTPKEFWPHHKNHNILGLEPLEDLCLRLKVPNDYHEIAKMVIRWHNDFHNLLKRGPGGIVRLFENIDAYRRESRLLPYLYCCKADFLGRKGFENMSFPSFDAALEMFNLTKEVTAREFVEKGLKGRDIKQAIFNRRSDIVADYIKTLPPDVLADQPPPSP